MNCDAVEFASMIDFDDEDFNNDCSYLEFLEAYVKKINNGYVTTSHTITFYDDYGADTETANVKYYLDKILEVNNLLDVLSSEKEDLQEMLVRYS